MTFLLWLVYTILDVTFGTGELVRRCFKVPQQCSDAEFFPELSRLVFRSEFIYYPLIVVFVSLPIALLSPSPKKYALLSITILPFALFQLFLGSSELKSIILAFGYLAVSNLIGFAVHLLQKMFRSKSEGRSETGSQELLPF